MDSCNTIMGGFYMSKLDNLPFKIYLKGFENFL